ncbi:MAG: hypothetical protein M1827_001852 [Pycnora praestabilis]|nr:MAG: hypothetical protein M1827_001852 [Pycnora praestabilis]
MAAYGKPIQSYDFNASRPLQETAFAYTQPPASYQPIPQSRTPHAQSTEHMPYMTESPYQVRSSYPEQHVPYIDARTRHFPEITSYSPVNGSQGTSLFVRIQSLYDFTVQPTLHFPLMFGHKRCNSALTKVDHSGNYFHYTLSADVPPYTSTGWREPQGLVYLHMEDEVNQALGTVEIGEFSYLDGGYPQTFPSPQETSRKRKISAESGESSRSPAKRSSNQQLRTRAAEDYTAYPYGQGTNLSYSPYLQPVATSNSYTYTGSYERPQGHSNYQQQPSPQSLSYQYSTTASTAQPVIKAQTSHTPSWSPSFSTTSQVSRSPGLSVASPVTRVSTVPSPSGSANPPLIRTSTLQHSPSPASTPAGAAQAGQAFNPYAMYPHKAVLKINGDLDAMAENWSREEWDAKRRLVQFTRQQGGSTIHTNFKPVAPEDRTPNSICISCIWWEEKKECYVTSVDTIYLLESLVAVRFTVEEKNRIRRNLEGFRPLTVSKAKADSEEFFKVVMAFPNPKPRNIEKDVKVFPWKILAHALKKIIGKYSASYSSTAGALLTPVSSSSGYASGGPSEAGVDIHPAVSPLSIPISMTSGAYATSRTSTALSPRSRLSAGFPQSSAGPPNLRVAVPVPSTPQNMAANQWSQQQVMQQSHMPQAMTNQGGRAPWDFSSYIDTSPATATPGGHQTIDYPRGGSSTLGPGQGSSVNDPHKSHQTSRP